MISERIYSNYVSINHSALDFTLSFCDIAPSNMEEKEQALKTGIKAPVQVEIVLSPNIIEPLISALKENYDKYKKLHGKNKK